MWFPPRFFTVSCCIIINRLPEIASLTPFSQTVGRHDMIAVTLNTTTVSCSHQRNRFKRLKVHTTWSQWFWSCCRSKSYYSSRIIFIASTAEMFVRKVCRSQPMATMLKAHTIKQETGDSKLFYKGGGFWSVPKTEGRLALFAVVFKSLLNIVSKFDFVFLLRNPINGKQWIQRISKGFYFEDEQSSVCVALSTVSLQLWEWLDWTVFVDMQSNYVSSNMLATKEITRFLPSGWERCFSLGTGGCQQVTDQPVGLCDWIFSNYFSLQLPSNSSNHLQSVWQY